MKRLVYLDNAATTQPFPEVLDAMIPYYSRYYGNPSSGYELGEESKRAMSLSRKWIADTLQVAPETIYFTSGGTESDNWALMFAVSAQQKVCATYHNDCNRASCDFKYMQKSGKKRRPCDLSAGKQKWNCFAGTR